MHPVAELLTAAAAGRFPAADGSWRRVPPWRPGMEAVVALTGYAVLAVAPDLDLDGLQPDGFGGAHHPRVLAALAGPDGWIDSLDAVLVGTGTGTSSLVERPDLAGHPRVAFARGVRDDVRAFGYPAPDRSVVTVARGLGGLAELNVELDPATRGRGEGTRLVRAALGLVPGGEPVVAAVAPGNAASLRAFLAAGLHPVGSVQLYRPVRTGP